jgi:putative transposase
MNESPTPVSYKGFRFPQEIIAHALWLSFRFNLSFRELEEFLASRRVVVPFETIRQWCRKFGQQYADQLLCWLCSSSAAC